MSGADNGPAGRRLADQRPDPEGMYREPLRPQFHFSQRRGWNNDPNGMVYYDGEYHLFWQCNPVGLSHANMYWGHATSPDMVHWTEQDRALRSFGDNVENRHPAMAVKNCFSGSGKTVPSSKTLRSARGAKRRNRVAM